MKKIALPFGLPFLRSIDIPRKLGVMERLYGASLASHGVCWVSCANGVTWKLDLADPCHRWIVYGDYEGSAQMNWIRHWLKDGGGVIDSGANIGQMCQYFAQVSSVRVLCFEPLPVAHDWLQECLAEYPSWNVKLYPFGLSDRSNVITVQTWGARTTARSDWYQGKNHPQIDIEVFALDDVARDANLDSIRLWKLDVEGYETFALRGAHELLASKRIDAILIEVSTDDSIPYLIDIGYELFRIGSGSVLQPLSDIDARGNLIALPGK
jgi:FkbM family methyltransferase